MLSPREMYKRISRYSFFFKRKILRLFFIIICAALVKPTSTFIYYMYASLPQLSFLRFDREGIFTNYSLTREPRRVLFQLYRLLSRIGFRRKLVRKQLFTYRPLLEYAGKVRKIDISFLTQTKYYYYAPL